jgi:soluble lytic murein transglycosylase-like protein
MYLLFASVASAQTAVTPPVRTPSAAEIMRASMEKQRASIVVQKSATRIQAESAGATLLPVTADATPGIAETDCDPIAATVVTPIMEEAARKNNLEVKLVRAVIEQESAFRPCAVSPKGAQGLMQLMPATAGDFEVKDPFDPKENIGAGAKYLKQLLDKYKGDTKLALAAYNAGSSTVDAADGVPDIPETRVYVDAILKKLQ